MVFRLKNKEGIQALDPNQIIQFIRGNNVLSGLGVSVSADLDLNISNGEVVLGGNLFSLPSSILSLDVADTVNPRKDVIWVDSSGVIKKTTGQPLEKKPGGANRFECATPSPASLAIIDDFVVLAEVFVDVNQTSLTSADVRDRRVLSNSVGENVTLSTNMTDWSETLNNEEVLRFDVIAGEKFELLRLGVVKKGGGASNLVLSAVNDVDNVVLASTSSTVEGQPLGSVNGEDLRFELTNNSSVNEVASLIAVLKKVGG